MYSYTQIPISIPESFLSIIIFEYIQKLRPDLLEKVNVIKTEETTETITKTPVR